jgi:hypothetical protein
MLEKNGAWVRVKKSRQLRTFESARVELTALEYDVGKGPARCLTLGIETFGQKAALELLSRACAALDVPGLTLDAASSASYPRWLAKLRQSAPASDPEGRHVG